MITLSLSSLLSIYLSICLSIHYLTISLYLCIVILFQAVWEKVVSFLKFKANPSSCIFEKRFLVSIPLLIKQVTVHQFFPYYIFYSSCSVPPHCFFIYNKTCLCKLKNKTPLSLQHLFHHSTANLLLRACLLPLLQNGEPQIPFTSFPSAIKLLSLLIY